MSSNVDTFVKKYPKNWVVMQNTIMQCFKEMTKDEKRLIVLASSAARMVEDVSEKTPIEITVEQFADECGIQISSAYKQMDMASRNLIDRSFSYRNERGKRVGVNWVIRAIYEEGYMSIYFPDEVLLMLTVLDKLNPYTKYKKENILSLKLSYSMDLYHLAKKNEGKGGFSMSLDEYREELGTPKSYERINNLKDNAVDRPIEEINSKTDINITYDNVRRGRTVVGLEFKVKPKRKTKPLIDIQQDSRDIPPLTDKQIDLFLDDFANDPRISSSAPMGMTMNAFKSDVRTKLKNNEYVQKHKKILIKVGYKFT